MSINPHIGEGPVATAWYDQFSAELKEESYQIFEDALHARGFCSGAMSEDTWRLFDDALQCGATAMAKVLELKGRIAPPGDAIDNGLLASVARKLLARGQMVGIDQHNEQIGLSLDDTEVELTPAELTAVKAVLAQ